MRITHVVENLGRGGLERMVIDLVEHLISQGHECQIICLFTAGEMAEEAISKGIECIVCNKKKGVDIAAMYRLRAALIKQKTEVIHTHNAVAHYYSYFASQFLSIGCFINTRHGMGTKNSLAKREKHFKRTLGRTSYVAAVCEAAMNKLVEEKLAPTEKCVVVRNGIKVAEYSSLAPGKSAKYNMITIGSIGRLNWAKDFFTLLDAYQILTKEFDNIHLVIAGGGSLENELKAYSRSLGIESRVEFLGNTENVKPVLQGMDIFVSSSVSEGYSIALLEACAIGLPVVATDVGGSAEIVRHNENGLVVEPRDKVALANSISILIKDKTMRDKFAANGRQWVFNYGDIENMSQEYMRLYSTAINK